MRRHPFTSRPEPDRDAAPPRVDFAQRLEQHIERSACGRVSDLRVDCIDGAVILHGRCRTYHAKQLVLQAALDMAGGVSSLINQITVS